MIPEIRATYDQFNVQHTKDHLPADGHSYRCVIGDHTYGLPDVYWWGEDVSLEIGQFCSISSGAKIILGGNHRTDWVTTFPFSNFDPAASHILGHPTSNGGIRIGNDVWLGADCRILSGVTIGDGAVIATGALVTRDVPPYAIVGGVPAKVIRMRFEDDQIEALLSIRWWDWPIDRIRAFYDKLLSPNIDGFIAAARAASD